MSILTVIPSTGQLRACDIRDTLNANGGSVTNLLQTFFTDGSRTFQHNGVNFTPNARINKWARRKPVVSSSDTELTDAQFSALSCGLACYKEYIDYEGNEQTEILTGGYYSSLGGLKDNVEAGVTYRWKYVVPAGNSYSKLRLSDFRGYNPSAQQSICRANERFFVPDSNGNISIEIYDSNVPEGSILAADIQAGGVSAADMYPAVMMWKNNNILSPSFLGVASAAQTIAQGATAAPFRLAGVQSGTSIKYATFLSSIQIPQTNDIENINTQINPIGWKFLPIDAAVGQRAVRITGSKSITLVIDTSGFVSWPTEFTMSYFLNGQTNWIDLLKYKPDEFGTRDGHSVWLIKDLIQIPDGSDDITFTLYISGYSYDDESLFRYDIEDVSFNYQLGNNMITAYSPKYSGEIVPLSADATDISITNGLPDGSSIAIVPSPGELFMS